MYNEPIAKFLIKNKTLNNQIVRVKISANLWPNLFYSFQ